MSQFSRRARTITAAVAIMVLCPPLVQANAVISEVLWMGSDLSSADEWVEITLSGNSAGPLNLSGYTLTSMNSSGNESVLKRFGSGDVLQSAEFAVLSNYPATSSRLLVEPRWTSTVMSLPNTKLLLRLRDPSGAIVDDVDDGVGVPFAGANPSAPGLKASMERIDLTQPGNAKDNWKTASDAKGFDAGALCLGTPGFGSSGESSSSSTSTSSISSSIESSILYIQISSESYTSTENSSTSVMQSSLSDSSSSLQETSTPSFVSSVSSALRSSQSEGGSDSSASSDSSVSLDSVVSSYSSTSSHSFASSASPAPRSPQGGVGSASSISPVLITEVLPDAIGSDDQSWIELGNMGEEPVNVAGWKLSVGSKEFIIPAESESGFILAPHRHVAFRKTVTGLNLLHAGATIVLSESGSVVDFLMYTSALEGMSIGRSREHPEWTQRFCVPTEGNPNVEVTWNPYTVIQSGKLRDEEKVSINLEAMKPAAFAGSMHCVFDWGDGSMSESCNPGAHVYDRIGRSTLQVQMTNMCGNTLIQEYTIEVVPKAQTLLASATKNAQQMYSSSSRSSSSSSLACMANMSAALHISEVLPNPQGKDTDREWIELTNAGDTEHSLCGWSLGLSTWKKRFSLDHLSIPAHGFMVIDSSQTKFAFRNTEGDVMLFGPESDQALEVVAWRNAKEGLAFARGVDGMFAWSAPTPGGANVTAASALPNTKEDQDSVDVQGVNKKIRDTRSSKSTRVASTTRHSTKTSSAKKSSSKKASAKSSRSSSSANAGDVDALLASLTADEEAQGGYAGGQTIPFASSLGASFIGVGWYVWRRRMSA